MTDPTDRIPPQSESQIQRSIMLALEALPQVVWCARLQSGRVRVRGGMMHLAPAGSPDIILGWRVGGSCLLAGIECKTLKGPTRAKQLETAAKWTRGGAIYVVARSVDQAVEGIMAALVGR